MSLDPALVIRPPPEPARTLPRAEIRGGQAQPQPDVRAPATPNLRMRLEGSLGLVVIEFREQVGGVANTIPSSRQLQAYRAAAFMGAPLPAGLPMPSAPDAAGSSSPTIPAQEAAPATQPGD